MFFKKAMSIALLSTALLSSGAVVNAAERSMTFNGFPVQSYEMPFLDLVLGYAAPDGHYGFNPLNGALIYSDGNTLPVLLGFVPTAYQSGGSGESFETQAGNFFAKRGVLFDQYSLNY